jgi:adenylate cyclase
MSRPRLHILAALLCTGLWAGAIWLAHSGGHLRFLDRLEAALSDARTLARGIKVPPDLVTIVAIDDTIVKLGGAYPLPRAEIAKIVEAIARLEPKVIAIDLLLIDKGPAEGDAALANALAASPAVLAGQRCFPTPFSLPPKATSRWPACRRPTASCCRCRHWPTAQKSASPM